MGLQSVGEVVEQLRFGQMLDPVVEIGADAPNRAGVGIDRLGLQPLQLQVLEMLIVLGLEAGAGWC